MTDTTKLHTGADGALGWRSDKKKCQDRGLNTGPPELQSVALPAELPRRQHTFHIYVPTQPSSTVLIWRPSSTAVIC